jgi:hypothetical protein
MAYLKPSVKMLVNRRRVALATLQLQITCALSITLTPNILQIKLFLLDLMQVILNAVEPVIWEDFLLSQVDRILGLELAAWQRSTQEVDQYAQMESVK